MPMLELTTATDLDGVFVPSGITAQAEFLEVLFAVSTDASLRRLPLDPQMYANAWAQHEGRDEDDNDLGPGAWFDVVISSNGVVALRGWLEWFCAEYLQWCRDRGKRADSLDEVYEMLDFLSVAIEKKQQVYVVDCE
jgi:hypothetical protein